MPDRYAPAGKIWQCMACGKTSHDLYYGPRGWDESCALNAQLIEDPCPKAIAESKQE